MATTTTATVTIPLHRAESLLRHCRADLEYLLDHAEPSGCIDDWWDDMRESQPVMWKALLQDGFHPPEKVGTPTMYEAPPEARELRHMWEHEHDWHRYMDLMGMISDLELAVRSTL